MRNDKLFLFPSGASHAFGCLLLMGIIGVSVYDFFWGDRAVLRTGNIPMNAILLFGVLAYTSLLESCMMILSKGYLFAYNANKAICVPIINGDIRAAVTLGQRLYGPIFDKNCETRFSSRPKSPFMRRFFYAEAILMFLLSLIAPCHHFVNALHTKSWSWDLTLAGCFIFIDAILILNRLFFRASIRRFWGYTCGDSAFRAVLKFELSSEKDAPHLPK